MKKYISIVLFVILFGSCAENSEPLVHNNSSKTFRLVSFERDAKPTSPGSYNLSVLAIADSLPDAPGNTFIAKSNGKTEVFTDTTCFAHWLNDTTVEVVYNPGLAIEKKETSVNGINVVYRLQ
jgi:PBP1b-binding outer membrane lipoprotein LpoB